MLLVPLPFPLHRWSRFAHQRRRQPMPLLQRRLQTLQLRMLPLPLPLLTRESLCRAMAQLVRPALTLRTL